MRRLVACAHFDISRTGTLVYRKASGGVADRVTTVQWLDASGKREPLLPKPDAYDDLRLSPDGKRLARDRSAPDLGRDIKVYDPYRGAMTGLTFGGGFYANPTWSPDGRYIVFGSVTGGMFWTRADGAGQPQALTESRFDEPSSFSPDGKRLAYNRYNTESSSPNWQIWTVPVEDSGGQLRAGKPEQFLKTQFDDLSPMFSPDGRWLAYFIKRVGAE